MHPKTVTKRWGFEQIYVNHGYCMKVMHVLPSTFSSIHRHNKKDETFYVAQGPLLLETGKLANALHPRTLNTGDVYRVSPRTWHRFSNVGLETAIFVEASTPDDPIDTDRATQSGTFWSVAEMENRLGTKCNG